MPSSFIDSVPPIMKAIIDESPGAVLDIGPGWGKYGLMCKEYLGDSLRFIDAIEVPQGRLSTQDCIYQDVYEGDARLVVHDIDITRYDLALIIDVIEHMTKEEGQELIRMLVGNGVSVLISTPKQWMEQHDENNPYEEHVSHWGWEDVHVLNFDTFDYSTIDSMILLVKEKNE